MPKRILIVDGHPDPDAARFGHALADAYAAHARAAKHEVNRLKIAELDFPILRAKAELTDHAPPDIIRRCQEEVTRADHLVILFPLWLGSMPALLKGFLEQTLRPGFAFGADPGRIPEKLLKGKSARIVATMAMPALVQRLVFGAHGIKSLKGDILAFSGFGPIRVSMIGSAETMSGEKAKQWLARIGALGERAE